PTNQLVMHKLLVNQAVYAQGLHSTQVLGTVFDGIARHTPEGHAFAGRAAEAGWREAVRDRDEPFGDLGRSRFRGKSPPPPWSLKRSRSPSPPPESGWPRASRPTWASSRSHSTTSDVGAGSWSTIVTSIRVAWCTAEHGWRSPIPSPPGRPFDTCPLATTSPRWR